MAAQISLTWVDNRSNEDGFEVSRSPNGTTGWTLIAEPSANAESYTDTDVDFGETWYYEVRAKRGTERSAYTNVTAATTPNVINPATLSGKVLYIDAFTTFAAASHNQQVSSWTDLSGNGYNQDQGTSSRQPKVQVSSNTSPSGKVLVRFDGSNDGLSSINPTGWPTISGVGYTLYFYGRFRTSPVFSQIWGNNNTGRPQVGYSKGSPDHPYIRTEIDGTAVKDLHNANIVSTKMQLFAVVMKVNGTVQAYRALSSGAVTALSANPTYDIGAVSGLNGIAIGWNSVIDNGQCDMDLATAVWVTGEHSLTTIEGVRRYLRSVYGED